MTLAGVFILTGIWIAASTAIGFSGGRPGGGPPNPPPGDPGAGGGLAMDDEAIGSLPITGGGVLFVLPGLPDDDLPPTLYISGPTDSLLAALIEAHGPGFVALHPTETPGHSLALIYGNLHLDIDASLFSLPQVSAGLVVGAELRLTTVGLFHLGRMVTGHQLAPEGRFELPIGGLYQLGLLKDGVDLFAAQAGGGRDHVRISAFGGVVSLHQAN